MLSGIPYDRLDEGRSNPKGGKFRASLEHFGEQAAAAGYKSGWLLPPDKHRLPIDDVLRDLLQKNSAPRIDTTRQGVHGGLRMYGPYDLVRWHLWHIANTIPDFDSEASDARAAQDRIDTIEAAMSGLLNILEMPFTEFGRRLTNEERWRDLRNKDLNSDETWHKPKGLTPTQKAILEHQDTVLKSLTSLHELREISKKELDFIWKNESRTGRPRQLWKQFFVKSLAHTWILLTGSMPTTYNNSPFAGFVYACWDSYDGNMPQVSFENAIRNLT